MKPPLIVCYGMGVDSTAMLVLLHQLGHKPDLIIFADTGGEKPETYAYLPIINKWLDSVGFPRVVVVSYKPPIANYTTLEGNCLDNQTMPSISFNFIRKSCSQKWKAKTINDYLLGVSRGPRKCDGWQPALDAIALGINPVKLIGFDASPADKRRATKTPCDFPPFVSAYPLQAEGLTRPKCVELIKSVGLPVPLKSACWFCAANQPWERYWLAAAHPDLFKRALLIELNWLTGKHKEKRQSVRGLSAGVSWAEWGLAKGIINQAGQIIMAKARLYALAQETMPGYEANFIPMAVKV